MIKLKNKPRDCSDCPFCYTTERYVREKGGVVSFTHTHCGAQRGEADFSSCPLE